MNSKKPLIILLLLTSFASVCAVLYTPALPEIANYLKITDADLKESIYRLIL